MITTFGTSVVGSAIGFGLALSTCANVIVENSPASTTPSETLPPWRPTTTSKTSTSNSWGTLIYMDLKASVEEESWSRLTPP